MKTPKCPCCGQRSNLRKVECTCGNYAMMSRAQIGRGFITCPCGDQLEPVCLLDRARCFDGTDYGREAWAEFAHRFRGDTGTGAGPDPYLSRIAQKGAATKRNRKTFAAVRLAAQPDMPF